MDYNGPLAPVFQIPFASNNAHFLVCLLMGGAVGRMGRFQGTKNPGFVIAFQHQTQFEHFVGSIYYHQLADIVSPTIANKAGQETPTMSMSAGQALSQFAPGLPNHVGLTFFARPVVAKCKGEPARPRVFVCPLRLRFCFARNTLHCQFDSVTYDGRPPHQFILDASGQRERNRAGWDSRGPWDDWATSRAEVSAQLWKRPAASFANCLGLSASLALFHTHWPPEHLPLPHVGPAIAGPAAPAPSSAHVSVPVGHFGPETDRPLAFHPGTEVGNNQYISLPKARLHSSC